MGKNFELCFKRVKTKYMILLGDDDIIIKDGIKNIYNDIKKFNPDLIYCKTFSFSRYSQVNQTINSIKSEKYNLESFLEKTILGFRLISSYVINTKYIKDTIDFSGNFAHLHVILRALTQGNIFIINYKNIIGSLRDNSSFDHEQNFSDIYVKEFFSIYRKYLENYISKIQ